MVAGHAAVVVGSGVANQDTGVPVPVLELGDDLVDLGIGPDPHGAVPESGVDHLVGEDVDADVVREQREQELVGDHQTEFKSGGLESVGAVVTDPGEGGDAQFTTDHGRVGGPRVRGRVVVSLGAVHAEFDGDDPGLGGTLGERVEGADGGARTVSSVVQMLTRWSGSSLSDRVLAARKVWRWVWSVMMVSFWW